MATVPKLTHKDPEVWTPVESAGFFAVAADDHLHPYWALTIETGGHPNSWVLGSAM